MKIIKKCGFFVLLFCLIQGSVFAENEIIFGTFPIPGLVIDENNGIFVELTKEIAKKENLDIKIIIKPRQRILKEFMEKKVDVFFPALDVDFTNPNEIIKSKEPLSVKRDYIFTRKGEEFIKTIKELEGKMVGITLGYPYSKELKENSLVEFDEARNDETNVLKLLKKRIDAFVVEEKAGLKAFKEKGEMEKIQYDPSMPISEMRSYYVFQNNEKGKKISEIISKALSEMKKDGTYDMIRSKKR